MLKLIDMAEFFRDLKGLVSEPVRASIVRRFCFMVVGVFKRSDDTESIQQWVSNQRASFVRATEIVDGEQVVPDDLDIEATELARFCNRWLTISAFRTDPANDWRPITPEMNSIRVTMVTELRAIAAEKFREGDLTPSE